MYNFLDNHDVNRIASLLKNPADLENAYTMALIIRHGMHHIGIRPHLIITMDNLAHQPEIFL